jgi:hypothetical protein
MSFEPRLSVLIPTHCYPSSVQAVSSALLFLTCLLLSLFAFLLYSLSLRESLLLLLLRPPRSYNHEGSLRECIIVVRSRPKAERCLV